uniref:Uncharacterized protein n=1 Tax=Tetranychus urticae TaxID=32264 RepID=T1L5R4_TETUR
MTEQVACGRWEPKVCEKLIYPLMGYNFEESNSSRVDVYRSHGYAGSSVWNLVHFGQHIVSGDFKRFDYGTSENIKRYNNLYGLSNLYLRRRYLHLCSSFG